MLFYVEQGPHVEAIIRQAILNNQPVPDKIAKAPDLLPWLWPIYQAFTRLTTCRHELGPIPWTAIHQYAQAYGFDDDVDELDRFETLISNMDSAYIEHVNQKRERNSKIGKKPVKKGRSR